MTNFQKAIIYVLAVALAITAYYFLVQVPGQQAQVLSEQQTESQNAYAQQQAIIQQKARCATQSQELAIKQYESSAICAGYYANADCSDNSTFIMQEYTNDYNACLQTNGI